MSNLYARYCAAIAAGCFATLSSVAQASVILHSAGQYAVVATGKKLAINSGPNTGDVLVGQNVQAAFSGGGNGRIIGTLFYDNTVTGTDTFTQLNTPPVTQLIGSAITLQAQSDAMSASLAAQALAPTQTFGSMSGNVTINGNGGLNVINVNSLSNATVTINGSANDTFIFNVAGNFHTNRPFILNGGVGASKMLFNLLGTSGDIFKTSGGNTLYGTFLSTRGGEFKFSNLVLTGALINTAGEVSIVSGSRVTYAGFVPAPGAAALLGLCSMLATGRRR